MAVIGIAQMQCPLRHAVKAQHEQFGFEIERIQLARQIIGQGIDIERIVVIGRQRAQARLPAHFRQGFPRLVHNRRGRRRAILRIERREQDAVAPRILHRLDWSDEGIDDARLDA